MAIDIYDQEVTETLRRAQVAARDHQLKQVVVDGDERPVPYPFPSPGDWRDCWIYFLMTDRFNNPVRKPHSTQDDPSVKWNQKYGRRQGGTFKGIQEQLAYIQGLGAGAIWLSPVLKNAKPNDWLYNYHGYGTQDFLAVDERFGSDGTRATAERELTELVEAAHARGLYVVLDIVLNHAARVFDYVRGDHVVDTFEDAGVMDAPLGGEPPIQWLNGFGFPRADWQDTLPSPAELSPDDAVWPVDLQRKEFFRRRGKKLSDAPPPGGWVSGDFEQMRQLVVEYDAQAGDHQELRRRHGKTPVLAILIRVYNYLIAKYDVDGFRIDTVKYVAPSAVQTFGNAVREFALSVGKKNFFTFGEIADNETVIAGFVGRNGPHDEGFGIDAALDFPLAGALGSAVKGWGGVEQVKRVFLDRKNAQTELLSSHGEAGRFFVSFLDNHDRNERFNNPSAPREQLTLGLGLLFTLPGIPCLYYGTEQGLLGTIDANCRAELDSFESVREALWGKEQAFDAGHEFYAKIRELAARREQEPALRYGRYYAREVSGNGHDFGHSAGAGGVIAFSRILVDRELLVVANTSTANAFSGLVVVDMDLNQRDSSMTVCFNNLDERRDATVRVIPDALFFAEGQPARSGPTAAVPVGLKPMEIQILIPQI